MFQRAWSSPAGSDEQPLSLQASWIGSWTAVTMAVERSRRSGLTGDLCWDPWWKGLGADSEEKREPASDIDTAEVDSLKVFDPEWPIREADIASTPRYVS